MKIVFSTKNVARSSFLELCRYAYDYGYCGFEIYDAIEERSSHADSILRRDKTSDAKRKLLNRSLSVSALRYPHPIECEAVTSEQLSKYVDMAANAGIEHIIIRVESEMQYEAIRAKLSRAIERAESSDVSILLETVGYLADTEHVIELINALSSACIGVCWNVRATYFGEGETAETTIKTLGAYIKYVRLGDMKDGETVLIGEGDLPVEGLLLALSSLNYEGYICCAWNEQIADADIVLTHFAKIGRAHV